MAAPLQCGDAAFGSEVALPSDVDVRGPAKRGETKADATDHELCRTQSARRNLRTRHVHDAGGASSCRIVGMSSATVGCTCIARWRTV